MKKILIYILTIFTMFIGISGVEAVGGGAGHSFGESIKCSYSISIPNHKWQNLECSFVTDGEYNCNLSNSSNETDDISLQAYNSKTWSSQIKDNIINGVIATKQCPYITYVKTSTGVELYAFSSNSDAWLKQTDRLKYYTDVVVLDGNSDNGDSTTCTNISASDCISHYGSSAWNGTQCCYTRNSGSEVERKIKEFNENLSRVGLDSDLDKYCILENNVYRIATTGEVKANHWRSCMDAKNVMIDHIEAANEYVIEAVASGEIDKDDLIVKKFEELSNKVKMTLGNTSLTGDDEAERIKETDFEQEIQERIEAKQREKDEEGRKINDCKGLIGDNTLKMLNLFLNFLMIIGPIIALVLGTYDLIVALANGEEDAKKKGIKKMKNRLIAAALLLLLPYIVKLILNIAGRGGTDCIEAMQNLLIFRSNI